MSPLATALIVGIVIGLLAGHYLGRWRAEVARARADMRSTWRNRSGYRRR